MRQLTGRTPRKDNDIGISSRKTAMKKLTFENVTYTCPFSDAMPPLSPEERTELKANIEKNGVVYDLVVTDENEVIDGHHRLEIAVERDCPPSP
jgi:disulfide oxidoreductase YuzD